MAMPPPSGPFGGPGSTRSSNLRKQALKQNAALNSLGAFSPVAEGANLADDAVHEGDIDSPASTSDAGQEYWDDEVRIDIPNRGSFNVYKAGATGAVVLCLHGGGYTDDVVAIWQAMYGQEQEKVPVVLLGHSMGGAIAVWAAATGQIAGLQGLAVVDVVEGTALGALPHMMGIIDGRPSSFSSPDEAVAWALRSGMSKNRRAACVSIPAQLTQHDGRLVWRTDLAASQPHWHGWYSGLSEQFLKLSVPKLLLLAGTDRLDRTLTIGQMQGKFQMVVLPAAGHAVHEDEPEKTADSVLQFLKRFRIGEPPMQFPKAVGLQPVLPVPAGPLMTPKTSESSS